MGDMADASLGNAMDDVENFYKYRDADSSIKYDEGLIDEYGNEIAGPGPIPVEMKRGRNISKKPTGPGPCPKCNSDTVLRNGQHGKFWGCSQYPSCKGSRNSKES